MMGDHGNFQAHDRSRRTDGGGKNRMAKDALREKLILDKGYEAVRRMAKEMVENGATLADILFHANQVWHEFKVGAMVLPGVMETGAYLDKLDRESTQRIITTEPRYANGVDAVRVAHYAEQAKSAKAGR
jgi:hypothetical protein